MRPILFSSIFLVVLFSCKSQTYQLDNLPEKQLVFGSGGGITGASDTYILLENGQLFHSNSLKKEFKELKGIGKKEAKNCFEKMNDLKLSEMDFNHPGNRYYFLEEINGETKNRVAWGSMDHEVAPSCKILYQELIAHLK